MKNLTSAFSAALKTGGTLAYFLRVVPKSGPALGYSSHTNSLTFDGVTFSPANGVEPSAFSRGTNTEVGSTEARIFFDDDELTEQMIMQGYLDLAQVTWFLADWSNPPADIDATPADCLVMLHGLIGKISGDDLAFTGEVLTPEDRLDQPRRIVTQPRCRATLGDAQCGATIDSFTGAVASVTNARSFTFTADTPGDPAAVNQYCTNGRIVWSTGNNAGAEQKIISHNSGLFLAQQPFRAIQVGDRFEAFGGCNKRNDEDCLNKYNNLLNFRGEPFVPGSDTLIRSPS